MTTSTLAQPETLAEAREELDHALVEVRLALTVAYRAMTEVTAFELKRQYQRGEAIARLQKQFPSLANTVARDLWHTDAEATVWLQKDAAAKLTYAAALDDLYMAKRRVERAELLLRTFLTP